ncbi:MAG: hypothetical protein KDC95_03445 [Planctomycetes bacterium]|nr:hypothetical protein [Planctomycetota bacterium]
MIPGRTGTCKACRAFGHVYEDREPVYAERVRTVGTWMGLAGVVTIVAFFVCVVTIPRALIALVCLHPYGIWLPSIVFTAIASASIGLKLAWSRRYVDLCEPCFRRSRK